MELTIEGEGAGAAKGAHLGCWQLLAAALAVLRPRLHVRCCHACCLPVSLCSLYAQTFASENFQSHPTVTFSLAQVPLSESSKFHGYSGVA